LIVFIGLNIGLRIWLPSAATVRVVWLVPAVEGLLVVVILFSDPGNLARRRDALRRAAVTLVVVLVAAALWSTTLLIYDLIKGTGVTQSATELLASGSLIWLGNNLAFALLYWLIDSGGPVARSELDRPIDFAFHTAPEPRARSTGLAAGLPRLSPPRLHERNGVSRPTDVVMPTDTTARSSTIEFVQSERRAWRSFG
jgi:hypothetical protein